VDLGNALPTMSPGGALQNLGSLTLACVFPNDGGGNMVLPLALGTINYTAPNWYRTTAGVVTVPVTGANLETVQSNALGLLFTKGAALTEGITEPLGGLYVRADRFVFRLEPGETAQATLYATEFGKPLADAVVVNVFDPTQLQGQAVSPIGTAPPVATPASAIDYPCRIVTDARGIATLPIGSSDPGNPRGYIDGQVYAIRPMLQDTMPPPLAYPFNATEFISVLVWDAFKAADPPTWEFLQPIFQQYANLYPVMDTFLDMADYESVCDHSQILLLAFGLNVEDPNSMPVTRDLSPAKRAAILKWLASAGPDGKPLRGEASRSKAAYAAKVVDAGEAAAPGPPPAARSGGKGAALARRNMFKRTR
jgi:hypothetical protein